MSNAPLKAALGLVLTACGLTASWWLVVPTRFALSRSASFGTGDLALGLILWIAPAAFLLAYLCWAESRRQSGWSRLALAAAGGGLALMGALYFCLLAYSWLFVFGTLQFAPSAPDLEQLAWVLAAPALVGGLWLLAGILRSRT